MSLVFYIEIMVMDWIQALKIQMKYLSMGFQVKLIKKEKKLVQV